jgi:hypothetical protein
LRDLKSGNVGQLNIHHYEIGFVQAISSASTPLRVYNHALPKDR